MNLEQNDTLPPIVVISGPTASGKSNLAIQLAKSYGGVIINGDSRQVYKELSIGTDKPIFDAQDSSNTVSGVKHALYGYVSIFQPYTLFEYQQDVFKLLKTLPKDQICFLTGGSGLFIDSVVYNYKLSEISDPQVSQDRESLEALSISELHKLIDAEILSSLNESDLNNPRRLIRLIEKSIADTGVETLNKGPKLNHLYLTIESDIDQLNQRIKERVRSMFKNGLLEEAERFKDEIVEGKLPALLTIGYQEFSPYFSGENEVSLQDIEEQIFIHTRQYAKRQRTWFRRNSDAVRIKGYDDAELAVGRFLATS